ncbi:uncharacterized protein [Lepeophtheirus salmonis]|uniref:uncharacterized protein isoform X2 n=1 Tax=Lepeophtheirus salmonis TaxID=72036 RepID=UPI001AE7FF1C|nr:uncharacterized protein LOC121132364 isoform X2 [Lepeophtheirus salmonis]
MNDEYIIILSIIGLRGLPTCMGQSDPRKYKVIATFKESKHETKEVNLSSCSSVAFVEDLAWATDRNTYHTLRSNKVPIRIQVVEGNSKIGALVLDLCDVFPLPSETSPKDFFESKSKWSCLIESKKEATLSDHPSIQWLLTLKKKLKEGSTTEKSTRSISSNNVKVALNENQGFFVMGSNPTQVFHLKIEIYFASKLDLAVNKDLINKEDKFFYFSYDIFGETIETKPFTDLRDPFFNVEEAVIKVHSSFPDIFEYFTNGSQFCVRVCSKKFILAKLYFSLAEFLTLTVENLTKKKTLESNRVFSFNNSEDASLGISISLVNMGNADVVLENTPLGNVYGVSENTNLYEEDFFNVLESDILYSTSQIQNPMSSQPITSNEKGSYNLSINLKAIEFDSLPGRNIRLRYKYTRLIKDTEVDSYDFWTEPRTRTFVPYGGCKFAFKVESSCLKILVIQVLDVNKNLQIIGESIIELFSLFHGGSSPSESKKMEVTSSVINLCQRKIGSLWSSVSLFVDSNDSENGNKRTTLEIENDESIQEWNRKQLHYLEEKYQEQWEKHETERCSLIREKLQKINQLEKSIQDSFFYQRSLSNTLEEKDKTIHELRTTITSKSNRFTIRQKGTDKRYKELSQEVQRLFKMIKEFEKERDILKDSLAKKYVMIKLLENDVKREKEDNSRLCIQLEKRNVAIAECTDKVSELSTQLRIAESQIVRYQIPVDKHKELNTIPVKRVRWNEYIHPEKQTPSTDKEK